MKINIYYIAKPTTDEFDKIIKGLIKSSSKFAKVETHAVWNKNIAKAQTIGSIEAQKSYTNAFIPFLKSGLNIALDVKGKKIDSFEFAELFENNSEINFFIGGAYGFEEVMLQECAVIISLSNLTFAHKIATLVLTEQIFRGLCIKNNHPYHK